MASSNGLPGSGISRSRPTSVVDTSASALSDYDWEQHGRDRHAVSLAASNLAHTAAAADEAERRARTLKRPKKGTNRTSAALAFPSTPPSDGSTGADPSNRSIHSDHRSITRSPMPSLLRPHPSSASPFTSAAVSWDEDAVKARTSPQQQHHGFSTSPHTGLKPPLSVGLPGNPSAANGQSARELLSTLRARTISGSSSAGGASGRADDAASIHSHRSGPPSPSPMPAQLARSAAAAPLTGLSGPIDMDARNASASTSPSTSVAGSFIMRHEASASESSRGKKASSRGAGGGGSTSMESSADATSSLRRLKGMKDWEGNSPGAIPKPQPQSQARKTKHRELDAHEEAAVLIEQAEEEVARIRVGKQGETRVGTQGAHLPGTPPGKVRGSRPGSSQEGGAGGDEEQRGEAASGAAEGKGKQPSPRSEERASTTARSRGPEPRRRKAQKGGGDEHSGDVEGSISRAMHKDWKRIDRVLDGFADGRHHDPSTPTVQPLRYNVSLVLNGLRGSEARTLNFSIPVPSWVPGRGIVLWAVDVGARGSAMVRRLLERS